MEGSPAALSGIRQGDVVIAIGGAPIIDPNDVSLVIAKNPNSEQIFTIQR